ncbi:MAG: MBL fold metallo-hydrolase [Nitrosopumilus sp.]|nr:MBL fold metallo-hydrolase [Nitrosopumilus sp.]
MLEIDGIDIQWIGHDGYRLRTSNKVIYIDPYKLSQKYNNKKDADLIFITHNHFDHLSIEDIDNLINSNTKIICSYECVQPLIKKYNKNEIVSLSPKEKSVIEDIKIEAVSAYNTNKSFHPKGDNKIGFIININNLKIYHTGDTDIIPEMEGIDPDIAFVPVSGTYVMNAEEAAKAVNELIKPKRIAIPMHYNSIVGSIGDAETFCNKVNVCKTEILKAE